MESHLSGTQAMPLLEILNSPLLMVLTYGGFLTVLALAIMKESKALLVLSIMILGTTTIAPGLIEAALAAESSRETHKIQPMNDSSATLKDIQKHGAIDAIQGESTEKNLPTANHTEVSLTKEGSS